jgi:hypothetical protein
MPVLFHRLATRDFVTARRSPGGRHSFYAIEAFDTRSTPSAGRRNVGPPRTFPENVPVTRPLFPFATHLLGTGGPRREMKAGRTAHVRKSPSCRKVPTEAALLGQPAEPKMTTGCGKAK